jgi:hypothetical protein
MSITREWSLDTWLLSNSAGETLGFKVPGESQSSISVLHLSLPSQSSISVFHLSPPSQSSISVLHLSPPSQSSISVLHLSPPSQSCSLHMRKLRPGYMKQLAQTRVLVSDPGLVPSCPKGKLLPHYCSPRRGCGCRPVSFVFLSSTSWVKHQGLHRSVSSRPQKI